jgi:hypothetical protein
LQLINDVLDRQLALDSKCQSQDRSDNRHARDLQTAQSAENERIMDHSSTAGSRNIRCELAIKLVSGSQGGKGVGSSDLIKISRVIARELKS